MTDAHTASGGIRLSFDPASLSEEGGAEGSQGERLPWIEGCRKSQ